MVTARYRPRTWRGKSIANQWSHASRKPRSGIPVIWWAAHRPSVPKNRCRAIATLIGDCAKGWLAVWLAKSFGPQFGLGEFGIALVALAVFLGHLWPVFFGFAGGKGVATALGVLLGVNLWLGLATLLTWIII